MTKQNFLFYRPNDGPRTVDTFGDKWMMDRNLHFHKCSAVLSLRRIRRTLQKAMNFWFGRRENDECWQVEEKRWRRVENGIPKTEEEKNQLENREREREEHRERTTDSTQTIKLQNPLTMTERNTAAYILAQMWMAHIRIFPSIRVVLQFYWLMRGALKTPWYQDIRVKSPDYCSQTGKSFVKLKKKFRIKKIINILQKASKVLQHYWA